MLGQQCIPLQIRVGPYTLKQRDGRSYFIRCNQLIYYLIFLTSIHSQKTVTVVRVCND